MLTSQVTDSSALELRIIASAFAPRLCDENLCDLLEYLNGLVEHRFTGIYRFEPGWVASVALFDRETPQLRVGAAVKMKESYCWLTGATGAGYVIEDAWTDARLEGHAARDEVRAYVAVLLRDAKGVPWGTLCHFDFKPRTVLPRTLDTLEAFRPLVEEVLVRDHPARWEPDTPS